MGLKPVYTLVNDLFFATKIVKTAQAMGLEARAFDSSARLIEASRQKEPALVIMDCEGLEKEAFQLLKEFRLDGKLAAIPQIGYLSHGAQDLKREMRSAGAAQVYNKSEFSRELENIFTRYAHGLPSRI
jgi:CheY-like chemotaxis protein